MRFGLSGRTSLIGPVCGTVPTPRRDSPCDQPATGAVVLPPPLEIDQEALAAAQAAEAAGLLLDHEEDQEQQAVPGPASDEQCPGRGRLTWGLCWRCRQAAA